MKNEYAISVVIPVYNQERYIGKCLHSILNQSFPNFEVIVVNDGSTDRSLRILQKYAQKDNRVIVIDKPNEGQSLARKDGFLQSKGKYIAFIDSDDFIPQNTLRKLYDIAERTGADKVIGNKDRVFDTWGLLRRKMVPYKKGLVDRKIEGEELFEMMLCRAGHIDYEWPNGMLHSLYRSACIWKAYELHGQDLFFPLKSFPEDELFNIVLTPFLKSLWITNDVVYHYRYGGCTTKDFPVIRKGGFVFDKRYDACVRFGCESYLSYVLERYVSLLYYDIMEQIYFQNLQDQDLYNFFNKEFHARKIISWGKLHTSGLPEKMKKSMLVMAVLNGEAEIFISDVKNGVPNFYKKMGSMKKRALNLYMNVFDYVASFFY